MARRGMWLSEPTVDLLEPISLDEHESRSTTTEGNGNGTGKGLEPGPSGPSSTLSRLAWIAVAVVLWLLLLAFPVRAGITVGQLRKVERQWLTAQALETDRGNVLRRLLPL